VLPYGAGDSSVQACLWSTAPLQTVKPQEEHEARKAMTQGSEDLAPEQITDKLNWGPKLPSNMDG